MYVHCVEEGCQGADGASVDGGGVVIEWSRRPAMGDNGTGAEVQEVLVRCRVGQFPARKTFYLLVSA